MYYRWSHNLITHEGNTICDLPPTTCCSASAIVSLVFFRRPRKTDIVLLKLQSAMILSVLCDKELMIHYCQTY